MKWLSGNLILSELYCRNIQTEQPRFQSLEMLCYHGDIALIISKNLLEQQENSVAKISVYH